tara:strand:+ start:478 stop:684 length:207 start_codon:yes stop_codon:yes gene_type:complete
MFDLDREEIQVFEGNWMLNAPPFVMPRDSRRVTALIRDLLRDWVARGVLDFDDLTEIPLPDDEEVDHG